jgi:hypothetical protein
VGTVGTFVSHLRGNVLGPIHWALSIHEETASLPLETNGAEGRGATVAEALEVAMGPSLKFVAVIGVSGSKSPAVMVTLWLSEKKAMVYGWTALYHYGRLFVS